MNTGTILIMRHAEKSGDPLDPDLTPAGRDRAQRLAEFIPAKFGKPQFLFATDAFTSSGLRQLATGFPKIGNA
jgi:broad specificity phosphatase PhoE